MLSVAVFGSSGMKGDALAILLPQEEGLRNEILGRLPKEMTGYEPLVDSGDFTGETGSTAVAYTGHKDVRRIILVGLGEAEKVSTEMLRKAAAAAASRAASLKAKKLLIQIPQFDGMPGTDESAQALGEGALLANYSYDKFVTGDDERKKKKLTSIKIIVGSKEDLKAGRAGTKKAEGYAAGTLLARDLANAPSNEIDPAGLAEQASSLKEDGVKVTVFDKKKIERLKMGGLLAVNQGSLKPPHFIVMEWMKGPKSQKPVVLVGKGITFDSGGISIKPSAGMGDMKMDMGGSAAVIGAMRSIARLGLKKNVVGLVPTTENLPSGSAYKPGDVVTFMNGKTAEIDNTDAEGRLILADALTYADKYNPAAVVDLATLTGACMIALGHHAAALMGNDDELKGRIKRAGEDTYERLVEFPLWDEYKKQLKSDVADVKNTGGRPAGSITAGLFLQNFIGDYKWAHIDIAGVGMVPNGSGYINKGGTGFGARLMTRFVEEFEG